MSHQYWEVGPISVGHTVVVSSALLHHYFESQNHLHITIFFQFLDQIANISYYYRKNCLHVDLYDLYFGGTGIYINNY